MSRRTRRVFTESCKEDTIRLIEKERYSFSEASKRFDISASVLSRWNEIYSKKGKGNCSNKADSMSQLREKNRRLQQENRRLTMEPEILKKAEAFH